IFLCVDQRRSLFQGVRQIPPGHYLKADSGGTRLAQYWDVDYPARNGRPAAADHSRVEEFQSRIIESIRIRLRSDTPIGCYLSGGVDSSSVLGIANAHSSRPIPAFTVAFDHADFDESAAARSTAEYAGVPFTAVAATHSDCADHFADA